MVLQQLYMVQFLSAVQPSFAFAQHVLVRRVAASAGDELISDDPQVLSD